MKKEKKRKNLQKVVLFLHKNNNVEKTPRTKREHKPGVGDHRSGRGRFESELNVRTVQEYTQRGEHGGMFFVFVVFKMIFKNVSHLSPLNFYYFYQTNNNRRNVYTRFASSALARR